MNARLLAVLLVAASCSDSSFGPHKRMDAYRAHARWTAHRPPSYTYEVRVSCFCAPGLEAWTEVHVVDGSVVSATRIDPAFGDPSEQPPQHWPTVDKLFEILFSSFDSGHISDIDARFDPELGYPLVIGLSCPPDYLDCGTTYYTRSLKPLP